LYSGINEFKKGIVARWRSCSSQLLNVHGFHKVRHTAIQTAEPLVSEPSAFEVQLAVEKLKGNKSPGIGHIPAELIKAGGRTICSAITNLLFLFGIRRNCLRNGRSRSFTSL
jgi:hypothetical protein